MTVAWRLTTTRHAKTAFTGEGARRYGGRWNHPGLAAVYTAATISLAALEYLAGADVDLAPPDLVVIPVEWGPEVAVRCLEPAALPADWRSCPHPVSTRDLGSAWLREGDTAILSVPSAIVPEERILVLNPAHRDAAGFAIGAPRAFAFDPRRWHGGDNEADGRGASREVWRQHPCPVAPASFRQGVDRSTHGDQRLPARCWRHETFPLVAPASCRHESTAGIVPTL